MNRLIETFRSLPRWARWSAVAGAGLLGYFAVVEPTLDQVNALNSRASARADAIREVRSGSDGGADALGVRKHGRVSVPGDPRERAVAFDRRVLEILDRHDVKDHTSTTRVVPMSSGPLLAALAASDQRVDRRVREIQFEASPEALSAVLSDLEQAPEVAAVSRVQVRKGDASGRTLRASVSAEAWILSRKGAAR